MRGIFIVGLVGLIVAAAPAAGQQAECRYTGGSSARLACYDKLTPPLKAPPAIYQSSTSKSLHDQSVAEDARMKKAMDTICRNC
jgi:hypothetical protein